MTLPVARVVQRVSWWRLLVAWWRTRCVFGCKRCRLHETEEGIGGRCDRCGAIYGWVTSEELRALAPGETRSWRMPVRDASGYVRPVPTSMPGPGERRSG